MQNWFSGFQTIKTKLTTICRERNAIEKHYYLTARLNAVEQSIVLLKEMQYVQKFAVYSQKIRVNYWKKVAVDSKKPTVNSFSTTRRNNSIERNNQLRNQLKTE